jgi:HPt (histidine-containing phosphotransfer) domain-containing protein/PAS domain-containing protein
MPDSMSRGNNAVFDILVENDTCAWVATQKGLYRFNPVSGHHAWYFREKGATEITIKGLTLDTTGILWVTTNTGLYRFDYRTNTIKQFTTSDGLQSNDFYRESMLTTHNGIILAGGPNGFNLIAPDNYSENRSIPEVVITDFHLFNEKAKIGVRNSPLDKQISETKKLTLSYKQSVLTFYFAVMDFSKTDKNHYAYRMENFDRDWIYCGNRRDATYTNLDPGRYRFHVKGSNNDGVWNETGTTLELVITPPWWKTKLARVGFMLLIILLLIGIYLYFRNKEEQKHLREIVASQQKVVASQKKVQDIMQSIDEAIFTINADMSINSEHSKIAEKIFGTSEFGKRNIAALFNMDTDTRLAFERWLKRVFNRASALADWEQTVRLNPISEVKLERENGTYLSVHYQPIIEDGTLSRIMVIVNDITLQKRVEQHLSTLNAEKELQMERVFGLVSNEYESVLSILGLAKRVIQSFQEINLDAIGKCGPRMQELGRDLHTLKGSAGSLEFHTLARCCDELESALKQYGEEQERVGAVSREHVDKAFGALTLEMQGILDLRKDLYSGKQDKLSVDKTDYATLIEEVDKGALQSTAEIVYRIRMLNAIKFSEFCFEYSKMVADYGARFEKSIDPLTIETPDVKIERRVCKALKGPVTHLIRNAVDHGIEDNAVREKAGKGPGRISMAAHENRGIIELVVVDDGGGIDPERVAASAVKKGIITQEQAQSLTDDQKRDLIFLHGFSTREETTAISGRGVGMDAVKMDIEKAGGGVRVESRIGQGARMILWIPNMPA